MATKLTFGKYKDQTFEQIAAIDPDYLRWMARESINRGGVNFSELAAQYIKTHEIEEESKVCLICGQTSCGGPAGHLDFPPFLWSRGRNV